MANILCIDTATEVCSVSLSVNGTIIAVKETAEEKSHASMITVFIEEILKGYFFQTENLDAVAVSKGPGSYTGLRIGVSVAKGICFGSDIPLIGINTLTVMAAGAIENLKETKKIENSLFCPMIDARRMEVYTALFDINKNIILDTNAIVIDETSFHKYLGDKIYFFGSGAEKCKKLINHPNAFFLTDFKHSSAYMGLLAENAFTKSLFENVAYFEPFYLKDFITTTPKRKIMP